MDTTALNSASDDVLVNMKLMRTSGFYSMFDPNATEVFGRNAYLLSFVVYSAIIQCILVSGHVGFFLDKEDTMDDVDLCLDVQMLCQYVNNLCKFGMLLCHGNVVRDVFDVARSTFFTSKRCREHVGMLRECRRRTVKLTNVHFIVYFIIMINWLIFPAVTNAFGTHDVTVERLSSVVNLQYTGSVWTYNQYHVLFYSLEIVLGIYVMYTMVMADMFILSFCLILIAQHEVLTRAFKSVGYEEKNQAGKARDFSEILPSNMRLSRY